MDIPRASGVDRILGPSLAAERIRAFARRAAATSAPVLILGETGTGKGVLARSIHELSARARRSFVPVNCAGVPETLFESAFFGHARGAFTGAVQAHRGFLEQASGGTLFLDEVAELPATLQAKLLTALEDGEVRRLGAERALPVDSRVIAATNAELEGAVARRRFRADLYHRLLVLCFTLPPLRERHGDLEFFAHFYLGRFAERYGARARGFDAAALDRMRAHAWPGNLRELAHAVEAAVLACDGPRIRIADLPEHVRTRRAAFGATSPHQPPAHDRLPAAAPRPRARYAHYGPPEEERRRIEDALVACRGNRTRAAARLGMARNTLRQKIRTLGLDAADRAAPGGGEARDGALARPRNGARGSAQ